MTQSTNQKMSLESDSLHRYQQASGIGARVLAELVDRCRSGVSIGELCAYADARIQEECRRLRLPASMEKGVALPTAIGINEVALNFAPNSESTDALKSGDCVKIELACHVDGHIATAAHTLVLPSEPEKNEPTEGHVADAYCAAYYARELLLCALRPGVEAADLATLITAVARCFHVQPVAHHPIVTQMQRFLPEVEAKQVILDEEGTLISPDFQVEAGDVFCIHVLMTTHPNGSRLRESDSHRPTLIQRNVLNTYPLKMQAARQALQTITQVGGVFPVHVRTLGALRERLGLNELVQHALVDWLPVWRAGKPGRDVVTQFKGTAIVQDDLTWQYTGGVKTLSYVHSMHALSPELQSMWDGLRKEVGELVSESEQMTMMDQMEC